MEGKSIGGLLIIVLVAALVMAWRHKVQRGNNKTMKTILKVGDAVSTVRMAFFVVLIVALVGFVAVAQIHHK